MELEEMKSLWEEMSKELSKQKKITDTMIMQMIETNYQRKIKKIWVPEIIGAVVGFASALLILMNIQKLDSWWLLGSGIISAFILFLLPVLSVRSIHRLQSVNISGINYKETMLQYAGRKKQFAFTQKLGWLLGALLLVLILPVMVRLFGAKNPFTGTGLWIWYPLGFLFFYFFSRHVFRYYMKSAADAEGILKELEN